MNAEGTTNFKRRGCGRGEGGFEEEEEQKEEARVMRTVFPKLGMKEPLANWKYAREGREGRGGKTGKKGGIETDLSVT